MKKYNIGIDLGGTNIKIGIVDADFKIIKRGGLKTGMPRPPVEIAKVIADEVMRVTGEAGIPLAEIASVGIGAPGTVDNINGVVLSAANIGFKNVPLGEILGGFLEKKVFVENDANAAAYGEYLAGSGVGYQNVVVVTLGTGVGGGIIINGRIYSGFKFCGAEIGHSVIIKDGAECTCGRRGCLEAYCSATALIRMTKDAMNRHKDSKMWQNAATPDAVDGKTAFDAMKAGDAAAGDVVREYIEHLGCGLTNIVNIFQPEIILIGGGICAEGDNLLIPLREYISREAFYEDEHIFTKLDKAKLGNDAGIIGAAFAVGG